MYVYVRPPLFFLYTPPQYWCKRQEWATSLSKRHALDGLLPEPCLERVPPLGLVIVCPPDPIALLYIMKTGMLILVGHTTMVVAGVSLSCRDGSTVASYRCADRALLRRV